VSYIESHQELGRHPKTKRLARLLSISLPCAVGHLQFLWWWAMDYAQDGHLAKFDAYDIADAAGWEGDAEAFLEALISCGIGGGAGFVERDEYGAIWLHDWQDYGGKLFAERKKNAEKQARYREAKGTPTPETIPQESRNRNVTVTSPVTLKERRGEERREENMLPSGAATREDAKPQGKIYPPGQKLPVLVQGFIDSNGEMAADWERELRLEISLAAIQGDPSAYMNSILKRWEREGLPQRGNALGVLGRHSTPAERVATVTAMQSQKLQADLEALGLGRARRTN
jgi:hypothetical protein